MLLMAFFCIKVQAQQRVYLSVNPFAVLEPQAAYGIGIGYQFNQQFDIVNEISYLTKPTWTDEGDYTNVKGFRNITTFKFTTATNEWRGTRNFVAAEIRFKKIAYDDIADFTNTVTHAVIQDYAFKNKTTTFGVAGILGKQKDLLENGRLVLEFTAGIGLRYITVNRLNTPANSTIVAQEPGFGETPNYRNNTTSFYFPLALRLILKL